MNIPGISKNITLTASQLRAITSPSSPSSRHVPHTPTAHTTNGVNPQIITRAPITTTIPTSTATIVPAVSAALQICPPAPTIARRTKSIPNTTLSKQTHRRSLMTCHRMEDKELPRGNTGRPTKVIQSKIPAAIPEYPKTNASYPNPAFKQTLTTLLALGLHACALPAAAEAYKHAYIRVASLAIPDIKSWLRNLVGSCGLVVLLSLPLVPPTTL
mmetsp:Transcript_12037/g.17099  ORF Transcript_12037/g.17099 Transcript_12037/m.17099 type:complete len:215 (+) Transcript_12037:560-1204(+)